MLIDVCGRATFETGGLGEDDPPTDSYLPIRRIAAARIFDTPIDGGRFIPAPLLGALAAFAASAGMPTAGEAFDAAAIAATDAYDLLCTIPTNA